ncbi:MAG: hypothetical protein ACM3NH_02595 [Candidatus Saccharibacteria bacterium]
MSGRRGVLSGRKFNGNHTTLTDTSAGLVVFLKKRPEVTKIVIGPISSIRPAPIRLKVVRVPAGLKISVRGSSSQQLLYAYTDLPQATEHALNDYWDGQKR